MRRLRLTPRSILLLYTRGPTPTCKTPVIFSEMVSCGLLESMMASGRVGDRSVGRLVEGFAGILFPSRTARRRARTARLSDTHNTQTHRQVSKLLYGAGAACEQPPVRVEVWNEGAQNDRCTCLFIHYLGFCTSLAPLRNLPPTADCITKRPRRWAAGRPSTPWVSK